MVGTNPATFLAGYASGAPAQTPKGLATSIHVHFDGGVSLTTSPPLYRVDAEQGYSIYIEATIDNERHAWYVTPEEDAVGTFNTTTMTWSLNASESLTTGHSIDVHLEGPITVIP